MGRRRKEKRRRRKKKKKVEPAVWKGGCDWMAQLPESLQDMPLMYLAIPGSHNSFSYTLDNNSDVDRNLDPLYRHFVDHFGNLATDISQRWTVTQTKTITQQLDLGVRYLDIRVVARQQEDEHVYFPDGSNILYALNEIKSWTDKHPKEVLIIDFTEMIRLTDTQHKRAMLGFMTRDLFKKKLLEFTGQTRGITLRNMWDTETQIIVFYPSKFVYDYTSVWPQEFIADEGTTCTTPEELIETFEERYQQGRHLDVFFRWMGVLVPGPEYLNIHVGGTLKKNMSTPATRAVVNWVRDKDIHESQINIVVSDFVEIENFCREVVKVNFGVRERKKYDFEKGSSSICVIL